MRARLAALLMVVGWSPVALAQEVPPPTRYSLLTPLMMAQIDGIVHSSEAEGENGFLIQRFRLGLFAQPVEWFQAVGIAEYAEENVTLFEGYAQVSPVPTLALSAGYRRTPMFHTAKDEPIDVLPLLSLSLPVRAFWPTQDVGIDAHLLPELWPLQAWLRLSNGTPGVPTNTDNNLAVQGRVDFVYGRGRLRPQDDHRFFGLLVGVGGYYKSVGYSQPSVAPTTAGGFIFWHPVDIHGPRTVGEAHLALWVGRLTVFAEGGAAHESRSSGISGDPNAPRQPLDAVDSWGGAVDLAYMIIGQPRIPDRWPNQTPFGKESFRSGSLEVGLRAEAIKVGQNARDVTPGGAAGGAVAVTWWATSFVAASVATYYLHYDTPPLEEPTMLHSLTGLARITVEFL